MTDKMIFTIAYFDIHDGKAEEFKKLAAECVEIVKAQEPGTLFYEWFLDEDLEYAAGVVSHQHSYDSGKNVNPNLNRYQTYTLTRVTTAGGKSMTETLAHDVMVPPCNVGAAWPSASHH